MPWVQRFESTFQSRIMLGWYRLISIGLREEIGSHLPSQPHHAVQVGAAECVQIGHGQYIPG